MRQVLLVGVLLVLAGCTSMPGGPASPADNTVTDAGQPQTPADTPVETSDDITPAPTTEGETTAPATAPTTAAPTPAERERTSTTTEASGPTTATPEPDIQQADNPWNQDTVRVALERNGHAEIDYERTLRSAIEYWNRNTRYGEYTVDFFYVADPDDADLHVEIRDSVEECGIENGSDVLGCAPLLVEGTRADVPVTVDIESGYNTESTEGIMIHEFGHILGIRHGEEPQEYMQPAETVYRVDQPNASERAYPWETTEFRFYAATDGLPKGEQDATRDQVGHVVDYYEHIKDEDDDVPSNISVGWTDTRSEANVVVSFPEDLPDGTDRGSSLSQFGFDPDGDGAIEYYENVSIAVADIDTDARGWHTGYWFGLALGIDEGDLPAPFQSASYEDRRSDWWTDAP